MQGKSGTFFVKGEKIVLRKDGTWMADGIEVTHEQTREIFFKVIRWDPKEKKYCLSIGYETIFIEVEDTPYFVTALAASGKARLSDERVIKIKPGSLAYENGNLYLALDDGQRAKFLSAPYYEILRGLQEDAKHYFLTIGGKRVNLSTKDSGSPASHPGAPKRP
jgi:hypothetical protein